jgi:hypothetical protein
MEIMFKCWESQLLVIIGFVLNVVVTQNENIALGKPATESNQYGSRSADKAVDGNKSTSPTDVCATTTPDSTGYSWWQVDLGETYAVNSVTFYVASDQNDGYKLKNTIVYIGTSSSDVTSQAQCHTFGDSHGIPLGGSQTFSCSSDYW